MISSVYFVQDLSLKKSWGRREVLFNLSKARGEEKMKNPCHSKFSNASLDSAKLRKIFEHFPPYSFSFTIFTEIFLSSLVLSASSMKWAKTEVFLVGASFFRLRFPSILVSTSISGNSSGNLSHRVRYRIDGIGVEALGFTFAGNFYPSTPYIWVVQSSHGETLTFN